jgi:hypothetical protein
MLKHALEEAINGLRRVAGDVDAINFSVLENQRYT